MQLNEEQTLAVEHQLDHPACLIAGAGSGKTRVLTERVRWLIAKGVHPKRICAITFTNKAADELVTRLGITADTPLDRKPRVSTIHSLALGSIRKNPQAFGFAHKITPLDDYDQSQLMKRIIERMQLKDINHYSVLEKIQFHRARNVGFRVDYTDDVHQRALQQHSGYHAMDSIDLSLWAAYEEEKLRNSVVDFDDMLHLTVRKFRSDEAWKASIQRMWEHVLMDEAQDTNQCHPMGTMVRKYLGYRHGRALTAETPIEELKDGDLVVAWRRRWGKLTAKGSPIKVSKRWYEGDLIEVTCGNNSVPMTPDHRVYAMLNGDGEDSYVVYLMWRRGYGYRVGQCALRYCLDTKHKSLGGVGARFVEEKADKGWILRVCRTKQESRAWEQILSFIYGIPTTQYEPSNGAQHREFIATVFANVASRGDDCLADHKLLLAYPLFLRETDGKRKVPSKRYFETRAVNLIPGLMSLPSTEPNTQARIDVVKRTPYVGWVYSLDVQEWHTYVANGIVVKNCQWEFVNFLLGPNNMNFYCVGDISQSIYGFNGAVPDLLIQYAKEWRGVQPNLYRIARNHRSVPEIVKLANVIQSKMTQTIPLRMESWRGTQEEHGETQILRACLPEDIAASIAAEIARDNDKYQKDQARIARGETPRASTNKPIPYRNNAILVRAASQIRDLETELVRRRIPYIVRGGLGLTKTEECRDVLAYLKLATNHRDFASFCRAAQAPKRGAGDAAFEKTRSVARESFDGDLIEAARQDRKLTQFVDIIDIVTQFREAPVTAIHRILALTQYEDYIKRKYSKDSDKVVTKLENIGRLIQMVEALHGDGMSVDDLIFLLTMDKMREDDPEGAVVISTIHSAKGLEWKRIYLTNITEGSLPHQFATTPDEWEEERRLFYVACTRARDYLILCVPEMGQRGPNTIMLKPSRFLAEIGVK